MCSLGMITSCFDSYTVVCLGDKGSCYHNNIIWFCPVLVQSKSRTINCDLRSVSVSGARTHTSQTLSVGNGKGSGEPGSPIFFPRVPLSAVWGSTHGLSGWGVSV